MEEESNVTFSVDVNCPEYRIDELEKRVQALEQIFAFIRLPTAGSQHDKFDYINLIKNQNGTGEK